MAGSATDGCSINRFPTLVLAYALSAGSAGVAKADTPGADRMPTDQVKQNLMAAGYTSITEFEADDGHWEGEGVLTPEILREIAGPCASKLRQIVIRERQTEEADAITLCLVHVDRTAVDALADRLRRHDAVLSVEKLGSETIGRDPDL